MRKFIIHAGFHKTATTTVQKTLEANDMLLSPHVEILHRPVLKPVRKSAQIYSIHQDPADLAVFQALFCELLLELDQNDQRPILMSSEDFSGYLIGRHGVRTYDCAPDIMGCIQSTIETVFGAPADLSVYYSTRQQGWLESCHWQLISNSAIHISLKEFKETFRQAADFETIVQNVADKIDPHPVYTAAIEEWQDRLGPLQPLLDLCNVPTDIQDRIVPLAPQNVGGSHDLRSDLLKIDGEQDEQHIRKARRALIRKAKKR